MVACHNVSLESLPTPAEVAWRRGLRLHLPYTLDFSFSFPRLFILIFPFLLPFASMSYWHLSLLFSLSPCFQALVQSVTMYVSVGRIRRQLEHNNRLSKLVQQFDSHHQACELYEPKECYDQWLALQVVCPLAILIPRSPPPHHIPYMGRGGGGALVQRMALVPAASCAGVGLVVHGLLIIVGPAMPAACNGRRIQICPRDSRRPTGINRVLFVHR